MKPKGRTTVAAAVLLAGLAAVGCGGGPDASSPQRTEAPTVVATTTIVADLVRSVAGDAVTVTGLMGPGIDPHLYKPSAGDVRRMGEAAAVFYNGLHLEGKMTGVLEQMDARGVPTVAVASCVPAGELIETDGYSGLHDPHVWFDVRLWAAAVPCVTEALAELAPDSAEAIRHRGEEYRGQLEALDEEVRRRLGAIPSERRVLVTAHDAFSYFGRAYGLEVLGLLGVSTAAEAGTGDVQRLADEIARRRIPAVFVETSVPERYVQALRDAVAARGFEVSLGGSLYSDALGNPGTAQETYVGTVRSNVETIATALEAGPDEGRSS